MKFNQRSRARPKWRSGRRLGQSSGIVRGNRHCSTSDRSTSPPVSLSHLHHSHATLTRISVVGEMIWNPEKVCWEGNESILDTFDSIPISSSARPVLIKHYTKTPPTGIASPGGPDTGFVKVVGDMKFDPERMCWVSNLDEDEDDPFEGMADDEDEDEDPGATITRASGRKLVSVRTGLGSSERSSRVASESSAGGSVMSWGEGASGLVSDLALRRECGKARKRHEEELKGWVVRAGMEEGPEERKRREESRLWEIRRRAVDF